jgi:hypothetical protein
LLQHLKNVTLDKYSSIVKKYLPTGLYYLVAIIAIYLVNIISPNQQDGGLGFGSVLILLLVVISFILLVINLFKGFKVKEHLIIAGIHALALLMIVSTLFL